MESNWAILFSVGPIELDPGHSIDIPLAVLGAESEAALLANSDEIQQYFDQNLYTEFSMDVSLDVTLAPNPVKEKATLVIKNPPRGEVYFSLWNSVGKPVATWERSISGIEHHEIIDLTGMNSGVYLLQVISESRK